MKTIAIVLVGTVAVGIWFLAGCHERHQEMVVVHERGHEAPPPDVVVVEDRPSEVIVVRDAPPPVRYEVRGAPPSVGVIWIEGYWGYRDRHYVWCGGHWGSPPRHGATWEHDRWERDRDGHGYRYVPGRWSGGDSGHDSGHGSGHDSGHGH